MKRAHSMPDATVIVFGGSYGGILAALCRIHYPDIFDMALAGLVILISLILLFRNIQRKHSSFSIHFVLLMTPYSFRSGPTNFGYGEWHHFL